MIKIISLDPGVTTGFSIAIITDESFLLSCNQAKLSHRGTWDMAYEFQPNTIICESFEYRSRARDNLELYSCELIGVVKFFCENESSVQLVMQTAAQGKGHFNDTKLKKLNLYVEGKQHGRDAVRHLMHWYTFGSGYQYNHKGTIPMLARTETILDKGDK